MESITEAKEYLYQQMEKGTKCPCCKQFVKMYKRKINSVMARCLIKLSIMGDGYHHVKEIVQGISDTGTNDFSKLKYWRLIEEMKNEYENKKTSGYWRITRQGLAFAHDMIDLPEYVKIYNKKQYGFSEKTTTIRQALGNKFNYNELMNS